MDEDVNYIVSGLERSGTSMMMQILHAGGVPVAFDESRPSDGSNPRGYYELEGGKIINRLKEGTFPLEKYRGKFIKITAYGIKFLPPGSYRIIYSLRDLDEIMDSMEKMAGGKDEDRDGTKLAFDHLNRMAMNLIEGREDIEAIFSCYNDILRNPGEALRMIGSFLNLPDEAVPQMLTAVDKRLYRQRRTSI